MIPQVFRDRRHAGRLLAQRLAGFAGAPGLLVLALPRGGVPVAHEVAQAIHAPLDVVIVRKLGVPGHEEYAMGALACGGVRVLNHEVLQSLGISHDEIERVQQVEQEELQRREALYRPGLPPLDVRARTVLLIDDGLATGATMRAAAQALRMQQPARLVLAVPTGAADTCRALRRDADEVVCLSSPEPFSAVGLWYEDFAQTGDDEVLALLGRVAR